MLREALGEALAKANLQAGASSEVVGGVEEAPIIVSAEDEEERGARARKQQRTVLVQQVRQVLERASNETDDPKGAFCSMALGQVTALAATVANLPGEGIDPTT